MVKAVIDIGSNSIKMRVADVSVGKMRVFFDETEFVRLSRGMSSTGILSLESMRKSCEATLKMSKKAERLGAKVLIVGTMALRTAKNANEFIEMVRVETGHEVRVLTGEEEAKFSWLGASDGFEFDGDAVMFDTGGGSTEFVSASAKNIKKIVSVPVGAVNLSEKFFPYSNIKQTMIDSAMNYIDKLFIENDVGSFSGVKVIGVGGGVTAMSGVKNACENFVPSKLHGTILTQSDIIRQIKLYSSLTLSERENIIGMPKSRADIILGSACVVYCALKALRAKSCIVSINGLRHGLLLI